MTVGKVLLLNLNKLTIVIPVDSLVGLKHMTVLDRNVCILHGIVLKPWGFTFSGYCIFIFTTSPKSL